MEDVVFSLENLVLIGEALVSLLKRRDPALLCGFFAIILIFGLIGRILPVLLYLLFETFQILLLRK